MIKISVLTPSIRKEGLGLVKKALSQQSFQEFEWLVGSPFEYHDAYWVKDNFKGGYWSLNRIYNKLIKKAKGELIVSWQDFTYAKPDALEKFWVDYEATHGVISGVGNKYSDDTWTSMVWKDPRERADQGSFYACNPVDIEINFAAIPKKGLYDIGGFDEEMDFLGFGLDGVSVSQRLDLLGYMTYLDQANKSYSLTHGRPTGWDEHNLLGDKYFEHMKGLIDKDVWPRLKYLV